MTYIHSHPDELDQKLAPDGTFRFPVRFPEAQLYKGWLQFKQRGIIHTVPFIVRATATGS